MTKSKSLASNVIYAFLLQIANIIFPLLTIPYVSKILGATNLGKVDFSTSIINWVIVFATCGITTYAVREVSKTRNNEKKLEKLFNELFLFKIISSIIVSIIYFVFIFFIDKTKTELTLFLTQGLIIILNIFQFDWFFQGIENYKFITIRSLILKIISFILMFVMIKEANDYVNYAIILIIATHLGNLLNFFEIKKNIKISFKNLDIKKHIPKIKVFFISTVIISMYNTFDSIILGFASLDSDVALFSRSKVFLSAAMVAALALSNAIMPRLNNYFETNKEKYNSFLNFSVNLIFIITIPMMVGAVLLSKEAMLLFGGEEFIKATIPFIIISPLIILVPLSTWTYQQIIIAHTLEEKYLKHQIIMAVLSVVLNLLLVFKLSYIGTAIAYLIVETYGLISAIIISKKHNNVHYLSMSLVKYIIASIIMTIVILIFKSDVISWINLLKTVIIGVICYFISLLILKEDVIMFFVNEIKNKLGSK